MDQGGLAGPGFAAYEDDGEARVQDFTDPPVILRDLDAFQGVWLGYHGNVPRRGMGRLPVQVANAYRRHSQEVFE